MQLVWGLLVWFVSVEILMTIFGVTTAPVLLSLAADIIVGLMVVGDLIDIRTSVSADESGSC